jgi:uncharacterized metal-binding protein YceD (DUF177 family)
MGSWGAIISAQLQLHSPLRLWCLRFLQVVALPCRLSQTIKRIESKKLEKMKVKKGGVPPFFHSDDP